MRRPATALPTKSTITAAILRIVAEQGLEQVSVREVAAAAEVSIGTVQHHFPTKERMLAAAYEEVVVRIRSRPRAVRFGDDVGANLSAVLTELLPLNAGRRAESRVHLAFAARAATAPVLAKTQRHALTELHTALTDAFAAAWQDRAARKQCALAAHVAIATADGLALHAVSSAGWLPPRQQTAALDLALEALLAVNAPA